MARALVGDVPVSGRRIERLVQAALAAAGVGLPARALACAVCAGGNPANRFAFFASTIVLSLLPLGLFVGAFLWLRARLRARGGSEFVERDAGEHRPLHLETPARDSGELHNPASPAL
jgi:hypothetical protein